MTNRSLTTDQLGRAMRRFLEPNWCTSDGVCECEVCDDGRRLVGEIGMLRAALREAMEWNWLDEARPPTEVIEKCESALRENT